MKIIFQFRIHIQQHQTDGPDLTWTYKDGTLTITGTGVMEGFYSAADTPWSEIKESVTNLIIEEGITDLSSYAFSGFENLLTVTLPETLVSIGRETFSGCTALENVYLPESVNTISVCAFSDCSALTTIIMPKHMETIKMKAFYECRSLEMIEIPEGITELETSVFQNCSNLMSVSFPESLNRIGNSTFNGCGNLKEITLPSNVAEIGDGAFRGCGSLVTIDASKSSLGIIGANAFRSDSLLANILFPESVTMVGNAAFIYCSKIQNIWYAGTDGQWAQISIGTDNTCLTECPNIIFQTAEPQSNWSLVEGTLTIFGTGSMIGYGSEEDIPWADMRDSISNIVVEEGITRICNYAFSGCNNLATVTLPETLIDIGSYAFAGCSSLQMVDARDSSLQFIGRSAFNGNSNLVNVILPDTLQSIDDGAFSFCSNIQNVWYSGTEEQWNQITIGTNNTYLINCPNIYFLSTGPRIAKTVELPLYVGQSVMIPQFEDYNISITSNDGTVVGVSGLMFTALTGGETKVKVMSDDDEVLLNYHVIVYSDPLILSLPITVTTIEEEAFEGTDLQVVVMGSEVQSVEANAFAGSGILQVIVPGRSTIFDVGAFGDEEPLIVCTEGSVVESFAEQNGYTYVYMAN